jgi:DNA-binding response OmpR family regulator
MIAPTTGQLALWSRGRVGLRGIRFRPDTGSAGGRSGRDDKWSVLVVEDDAFVAEMYRVALIREGFDVNVANDGLAGLEAAKAHAPDFVFLDIRMPRMDGLELLKRLRSVATTRETPVVMLTNFDDAAQIRTSMELGAKQYVVKTAVLPSDLPEIVSRWLPRSQSQV